MVEGFLRKLFSDHPGGIFRHEAVKLAATEGIPERALARKAGELGVVKLRQGRQHPTIWRPPAAWVEEA